MKRILHIKKRLSYDGASIVEYRFANELKDSVSFDWFLLSNEQGGYESRFLDLGSRIFHCPDLKKEFAANSEIMIFFRFLRKYKYDVAYFDTDSPGRSVLICVARLAGVKRCIIHSHASFSENKTNPFLNFFYRKLMLFTVTDYLACSKQAADWLFPKSKAKIALIIPNGIDSGRFAYNEDNRKQIRSLLSIPESAIVLGHVGRFSEVKNHIKLIGIFNEFLLIYPSAVLILIGEGALREHVEKRVQDLDIGSSVRFIGNTDDVSAYLSAMDIFVLPSLFEGLGIAAIEAECSGLNVYISDGVPDDAMLTPNTKKIPLSLSDKEWALQIADDLKPVNIDRASAAEIVRSKGYDIKDSAETLRKLLIKRE